MARESLQANKSRHWQREDRLQTGVYGNGKCGGLLVGLDSIRYTWFLSSQVARMLIPHDVWLCEPINFSGGKALRHQRKGRERTKQRCGGL